MSEQSPTPNPEEDPLDLLAVSIHPAEGSIDIRNNSTGHTRKIFLAESSNPSPEELLEMVRLPLYPKLIQCMRESLEILKKRRKNLGDT